MKKAILFVGTIFALSSCSTLFTSSRQNITFSGLEGTQIFDATSNVKLGEIGENKTVVIPIKKKTKDKQLLAKKEGYKTSPILLESSFNNTTLWNLLFLPGFIVDYGTGQMNEWENIYINVDLTKDKD